MSTTTLLQPFPVHFPSPSVRYLVGSWWTCHSGPKHTWRNRSDSLLASGQPLSVIPKTIRELLDMVITPVPGWKGQVPTWFGVSCKIGRVVLWLPSDDEPGVYRDFSLLALLPREELEDAPPFIHLGAQFLLEYQVQIQLDWSSLHSVGKLLIP